VEFFKLSTFDEEIKRQKQMTKQLAIDEVNSWIKTIPIEKRKQVVAAVGTKSFTAEDIAKEIQGDTEYGKKLVTMINKLRIETTKKPEGL
jgi:hypothetical protein